jgi:hypothetical protein
MTRGQRPSTKETHPSHDGHVDLINTMHAAVEKLGWQVDQDSMGVQLVIDPENARIRHEVRGAPNATQCEIGVPCPVRGRP